MNDKQLYGGQICFKLDGNDLKTFDSIARSHEMNRGALARSIIGKAFQGMLDNVEQACRELDQITAENEERRENAAKKLREAIQQMYPDYPSY